MRSILLCLGLLPACGSTSNRHVAGPLPASASPTASTLATSARTTSSAAAPAVLTARVSASSSEDANAIIATVAGHDILASELLELWLFRESPKVRAYLEELVLSSLVLAEAHRLEMSIAVALLDHKVQEALTGLNERLNEGGQDISVDDFIQQRLGLDPKIYRTRLRRETEIDLLAERCVRAWLMQNERAEVRVIVVEDQDALDEVQVKLEAGGDFALLADEYSIEGSGAEGGRMPPVVRSGVALSRLAFSTPVGKIGGPVLEEGRYLFLKVDERKAAMEGSWEQLRGPVETSLTDRDIEDAEYWQWKTAMLERYTVDMTPFLELVGERAGP